MKTTDNTPNEEKLYSVMVGFDSCLRNDIEIAIKKNKLKVVLLTDIYFYVNCATAADLETIKNAVKDIKFEMKNKDGSVRRTYKILYISAYKQGKMLSFFKDHLKDRNKKPRPGAHTVKAKITKTKPTKRETPRMSKRKSITKRGTHSSGTNLTSFDSKLLKRARKAGKQVIAADIRQAKKRAVEKALKPKDKVSKIAKQLELKLAA